MLLNYTMVCLTPTSVSFLKQILKILQFPFSVSFVIYQTSAILYLDLTTRNWWLYLWLNCAQRMKSIVAKNNKIQFNQLWYRLTAAIGGIQFRVWENSSRKRRNLVSNSYKYRDTDPQSSQPTWAPVVEDSWLSFADSSDQPWLQLAEWFPWFW
jgi:hypothetical protein